MQKYHAGIFEKMSMWRGMEAWRRSFELVSLHVKERSLMELLQSDTRFHGN
jgi:hypothetical protein